MSGLPMEHPAVAQPAVERRWRGPAWPGLGHVALGLALGLGVVACGLSGAALWRATRVPAPIVVQMPPPVPLASDAPLPVIGIELLLPHLSRPVPFPRPFTVARALAAGDGAVLAALVSLQAVAVQGAPTARQRAEGFPAAADAAVLAEMGYGADAGWVARGAAATMRLGAAFGSAPTPTLLAMREAREALALSDLDGAEAALRSLPPGPAFAITVWRDGLRRRLAADDAARRLAMLAGERAALLLPPQSMVMR